MIHCLNLLDTIVLYLLVSMYICDSFAFLIFYITLVVTNRIIGRPTTIIKHIMELPFSILDLKRNYLDKRDFYLHHGG